MIKVLYKNGAKVVREDRQISPLSLSIKYGNFFAPMFLLSLKEVIESLDDYLELLNTLIYTISTGSFELFKLIIQIIQPDSLETPPCDNLNYDDPNDKEILKAMQINTNYSLLHYA